MAGQARKTLPEVTLLDRIGALSREAFPTITAVQQNGAARSQANLARGEYARAAGNVVSQAIALPAAAATDLVGAPIATAARGVGRFLGGVFGMEAADPAASAVVPKAAAKMPVVTVNPVDSALAQGRAAPVQLTAQDALGAYISNVLQNGATIREAKQLGELVPAVVKQGTTAKNTVLGETAALSRSIFDKQTAEIDKALKAGTLTAEQAEIGRMKATESYFARNGGLVGFDPTKLIQAQLMGGGEDE